MVSRALSSTIREELAFDVDGLVFEAGDVAVVEERGLRGR